MSHFRHHLIPHLNLFKLFFYLLNTLNSPNSKGNKILIIKINFYAASRNLFQVQSNIPLKVPRNVFLLRQRDLNSAIFFFLWITILHVKSLVFTIFY
jgi:hypothetical protein